MTDLSNPELHREAVRRLLDGQDPTEVSHALDLSHGTVQGLEIGLRTAFPIDLLEFREARAKDKPGYPYPGQVLELHVVETADGGDGVAYLDSGLVVFVQGTEPTETVTARVTVVEDRYAVARPVTSPTEDAPTQNGASNGTGGPRRDGEGV